MIQADGLYGELATDMRNSTNRILGDIEHELVIDGEPMLKKLPLRKRIDFFLFYKECLVNIIRHSGATRVSAQVSADEKFIHLTINDNGCGLGDSIPNSLNRRARLLRAQLTTDDLPESGTRIQLTLRHSRFSPRKTA